MDGLQLQHGSARHQGKLLQGQPMSRESQTNHSLQARATGAGWTMLQKKLISQAQNFLHTQMG